MHIFSVLAPGKYFVLEQICCVWKDYVQWRFGGKGDSSEPDSELHQHHAIMFASYDLKYNSCPVLLNQDMPRNMSGKTILIYCSQMVDTFEPSKPSVPSNFMFLYVNLCIYCRFIDAFVGCVVQFNKNKKKTHHILYFHIPQ